MQSNPFNTEIEQKWQQNQHETSEEVFVHTINFFNGHQEHKIKPHLSNLHWGFNKITKNTPENNDDSEIEDKLESNYGPFCHCRNEQLAYQIRRKSVSLCRNKLQGRT